jgi:hypothetical protein
MRIPIRLFTLMRIKVRERKEGNEKDVRAMRDRRCRRYRKEENGRVIEKKRMGRKRTKRERTRREREIRGRRASRKGRQISRKTEK